VIAWLQLLMVCASAPGAPPRPRLPAFDDANVALHDYPDGEVRKYELDLIEKIIDRYPDIVGIHIEEPGFNWGADYCHCDYCRRNGARRSPLDKPQRCGYLCQKRANAEPHRPHPFFRPRQVFGPPPGCPRFEPRHFHRPTGIQLTLGGHCVMASPYRS
jgi:hypothetical protein